MKLYIRPMYRKTGDREEHVGFMLATTTGDVLLDEQVFSHYSKNATGKQMKADAAGAGHEAEWGRPIYERSR